MKQTPLSAEPPIVCVRWVDACEPEMNSDLRVDDRPEVQKVCQLGFMIDNSSCSITIAGARKPDAESATYDYMITIPRCCISEITIMEAAGSTAINRCGQCED